jgi:hypothetical protein
VNRAEAVVEAELLRTLTCLPKVVRFDGGRLFNGVCGPRSVRVRVRGGFCGDGEQPVVDVSREEPGPDSNCRDV